MVYEIAEGVYGLDTEIRVMSGVYMPARMTVLRCDDGLLMISPVAISDEHAGALAKYGDVTRIVSPNKLHHLFAKPACERYPQAKYFAARGLAKKRPDLPPHDLLPSDEARAALAPTELFPIEGMPMVREVAFHHPQTRTLVVTDLLFNLRDTPRGFLSPLVYRAFGTNRRLAASRLALSAIKDRAAFSESLRPLLALDVDRIVCAHGDVIEDVAAAKEVLRKLTV